MGQEAMKVLFKEPNKEAVKETLAEEGITESSKSELKDRLSQEETTQEIYGSQETEDESGGVIRNIVIPGAVVLGVVLALRQLNEGQLEPDNVAEKIRGAEQSMEESTSEHADAGRQQFAEDDSDELNV